MMKRKTGRTADKLRQPRDFSLIFNQLHNNPEGPGKGLAAPKFLERFMVTLKRPRTAALQKSSDAFHRADETATGSRREAADAARAQRFLPAHKKHLPGSDVRWRGSEPGCERPVLG